MLAFSIEVLRRGTALQLFDSDATLVSLFFTLLAQVLLSLGLALLLESEVELEWQYLRVVLIKVLATADLRVLKLVENLERISRQRLVQYSEEPFTVGCNALVYFIHVALNSEQVCLYARALSTHGCAGLCSTKEDKKIA